MCLPHHGHAEVTQAQLTCMSHVHIVIRLWPSLKNYHLKQIKRFWKDKPTNTQLIELSSSLNNIYQNLS